MHDVVWYVPWQMTAKRQQQKQGNERFWRKARGQDRALTVATSINGTKTSAVSASSTNYWVGTPATEIPSYIIDQGKLRVVLKYERSNAILAGQILKAVVQRYKILLIGVGSTKRPQLALHARSKEDHKQQQASRSDGSSPAHDCDPKKECNERTTRSLLRYLQND